MKKILLATRPLTPPWDEASKNFAYFLAKSIHDPELEIHILTTPDKLEGLPKNVVQHPIYPRYDATRAGHSFSQKAILSTYLFTQSHKYDIVHYLFTPTAFNAALIKNFTYRRPKTIQTIATLREDLYGPENWKRMLFADRIVTYSNYSKAKLEMAGFNGTECIYPGIDLDLYSPKPKDPEALKHFNLTPQDFVVMHNGEYVRLDATDTIVDMLIKNLQPTTDDQQPIKFIFGNRVKNEADQKKKDEVVAKLTEAGIIDQVRFTDTWKDMPKLYNLSDIIVFPVGNMKGKFDIPLVVIEGYACEKPVILSDLEIFKEFSNPEFSVTIPKGNSSTLWQAIEDLKLNQDKQKTLGKHARVFTEQYFDLRDTAKKYSKLYRLIR